MKKTVLLLLVFCGISVFGYAQNCIDYIIYRVEYQNESTLDTLACKIMNEDETGYVIDNGLAITTIPKKIVQAAIPCAREMTANEMYRFKGIDNVTRDYFQNNKTAGSYLRKAGFKTYLSIGLGVAGAGSIALGATTFKGERSQNYWIVGGSLAAGTSLFFMILAWNNVYKAGKLLDLNSKAALYLAPAQNGDLGLSVKF